MAHRNHPRVLTLRQHRIRIYEWGSPEVLCHEEADIGAPGPGQIRLRQHAIGINFVDRMYREGRFNVPLPFVPGVEGAGVVESVGPKVSDLRVGDRVAYWFSPGAYADVRLIEATALVKLPQDIAIDAAAATFAKGMTAWAAVKRAHLLRAGETALIQGASGGVGSLLATWAQSLGARVIATVGSPGKVNGVSARGIERVFRSDDPDLVSRIIDDTGGVGVDVVYELVGKATFAKSLASVRNGGDFVHLGNASGTPEVDKRRFAARSIRYIQPMTGQYIGDRTALEQAAGDWLWALRAGVFEPVSITRYSLAAVVQAHEDLAAGRVEGSAVLIPSE